MDYAQREFALSLPDETGHSYREHLTGQLARARTEERRREIEGELALPPFPNELDYLWRAFQRLRRRSGGAGLGPAPLTLAEIEAFQRLAGLRLAPWEVELLEDLDDALLAAIEQARETVG